MKLTFLGATHEVTGSCFLLEACGKNILIDCGMEQGRDIFENQEIPISSTDIDAVFLTHAHIDHSGKLPLLYAKGFRGDIHATRGTSKLCAIMLQDSAHIQVSEAEWKNRKAKRSGGTIFSPIYNMEDAMGCINSFVPHDYNKKEKIFDGIEIRFIDAGHLLGSASIEVWLSEGDTHKKIVFSGDIGNIDQPLINDPQYIKEADYVVMESTYGDRNHAEKPDYIVELTEAIQDTFDRGGNLIIPSFAVGRTQNLLYFIREIKERGLVKGHPNFKVYMDSPMAIEATEIFNDQTIGYFDQEAMKLVNQGINPVSFPGLMKSVSVDESKAINFDKDPKIIISASGMCDAGRIRHHLKHNLWRKDSTILFVGHQSVGSLGHLIINGAKTVKLFGETIEVNAKISKLSGASGHGDRAGLLKWITSIESPIKRVFVVHGESNVSLEFAKTLQNDYAIEAVAPYNGAVYDLANNEYIEHGKLAPLTKLAGLKQVKKAEITPYERLIAAGKSLLPIIEKNKGLGSRELIKFTDQINSLINKWK